MSTDDFEIQAQKLLEMCMEINRHEGFVVIFLFSGGSNAVNIDIKKDWDVVLCQTYFENEIADAFNAVKGVLYEIEARLAS